MQKKLLEMKLLYVKNVNRENNYLHKNLLHLKQILVQMVITFGLLFIMALNPDGNLMEMMILIHLHITFFVFVLKIIMVGVTIAPIAMLFTWEI